MKGNYIASLVNVYSKIKLVPYCLEWSVKENNFFVKSSFFMKTFCAVLHSLALIPCFGFVSSSFSRLSENGANFRFLYEVLEDCIFFSLIVYQVYFWWQRQPCFLKLVNKLHPFICAIMQDNKRNSAICFGFCAVNFLIGMTYEIIYQDCQSKGLLSANFILNLIMKESNKNLQLSSLPYYMRYFHYAVKCIVTFLLTIVSSFHMFQHGVLISVLLGIKQGISLYSEMKRCMQQLNELFTVPMLLIYLNNLTSFAALPQVLMCNECSYMDKITERMFMVFYALVSILIWIVSAQLHVDIQNGMRTWVYGFHHCNGKLNFYEIEETDKMRKCLPIEKRMKLISFLNEVETDGLGVSCKFFTITYSTFGSTVGLIITYAIVLHQFNYSH